MTLTTFAQHCNLETSLSLKEGAIYRHDGQMCIYFAIVLKCVCALEKPLLNTRVPPFQGKLYLYIGNVCMCCLLTWNRCTYVRQCLRAFFKTVWLIVFIPLYVEPIISLLANKHAAA